MVSKAASEPDPKPNYGRMFLHVGAAGVMVAGFNALSSMAVGKVITPQVSLTPNWYLPMH
jgi:hypothetical protein